ncbi:hypothetical protein Tco_1062396 [Tanacetum coccineum]
MNYHRPYEVPQQLCIYNPQPLEDEAKYQKKRYYETICVRNNDVEFALPPEPTSDAENDFVNSREYDGVDHEENDGAVVLTNESESENLHDTIHVVTSGENDEVDHYWDNDSNEDANITHSAVIYGSFGVSSSGTTSTPPVEGEKNTKDLKAEQPIN